MAMSNLPHPGRSIRKNCLDPLGLNVTEAAKVLGVARHTLSRILNGHAAISPEMAVRLGEGGLLQCRVLAAPTDHLGSPPGRQAVAEFIYHYHDHGERNHQGLGNA